MIITVFTPISIIALIALVIFISVDLTNRRIAKQKNNRTAKPIKNHARLNQPEIDIYAYAGIKRPSYLK